jgi:hypothetical protein
VPSDDKGNRRSGQGGRERPRGLRLSLQKTRKGATVSYTVLGLHRVLPGSVHRRQAGQGARGEAPACPPEAAGRILRRGARQAARLPAPSAPQGAKSAAQGMTDREQAERLPNSPRLLKAGSCC